MQNFSRRKFVAIAATGIATAPLAMKTHALSGKITVQEVLDRIKKNIGVDWKTDTVDTFKVGDQSTGVTGIATTSLATLAVLDRAIKAGANLVVTSEPTFFSKADLPTPPVRRGFGPPNTSAPPDTPSPSDPVFTGKDEFIRKHKLVVLRLSDHWQLRKPNPFAQGLAAVLGFAKADSDQIAIPETSLDALAAHVKKSLKARGGMRIVGQPEQRIRKIGFLPGSTPIQAAIAMLPKVDAIIAGEVREWETVEYVRDTVALSGNKSLILVGRVVSEDPGMQVCAQWLKTICPEVASTWVSAGDPYWRPTA
jgi:putative NIF3 family GTP cyclohydrolase 1 type 2